MSRSNKTKNWNKESFASSSFIWLCHLSIFVMVWSILKKNWLNAKVVIMIIKRERRTQKLPEKALKNGTSRQKISFVSIPVGRERETRRRGTDSRREPFFGSSSKTRDDPRSKSRWDRKIDPIRKGSSNFWPSSISFMMFCQTKNKLKKYATCKSFETWNTDFLMFNCMKLQ